MPNIIWTPAQRAKVVKAARKILRSEPDIARLTLFRRAQEAALSADLHRSVGHVSSGFNWFNEGVEAPDDPPALREVTQPTPQAAEAPAVEVVPPKLREQLVEIVASLLDQSIVEDAVRLAVSRYVTLNGRAAVAA